MNITKAHFLQEKEFFKKQRKDNYMPYEKGDFALYLYEENLSLKHKIDRINNTIYSVNENDVCSCEIEESIQENVNEKT